jgi:eukaryotic-like serine/threonine-protein kinase
MTRIWNDLEGVSFAGRYALEQCLSATDGDAWYATKLENGAPAAMRVAPEDGERLALWREAMAVDHPNLVRLFDAGRTQVENSPLIYAVCEFPDDFLAGVLQERPLSPVEAREVLRAVLSGLKYLHKRGLVHGAVDPSHIMAFGDHIKLQSDTWELPAPGGRRRVGPYDAPECARGAIGPASDVWSLAVTLHEVLTQQRPNLEHDSEFRYMAEPFATLLRRCLVRAPEARWTVEDAEAHLHPGGMPAAAPSPVEKPSASAKPEDAPVAPAPLQAAVQPPSPPIAARPIVPPPPPPNSPVTFPQRSIPMWWVPVAGLVAALGLGFVFLRQPQSSQSAPPPPRMVEKPVRTAEPPRTTPAPPARKPSPMPSASREDSRWRVIAFTYAQRSMAEKKAQELNQRHPQFRAEVFAPASEHGPFLISLGGRMTREEALSLQQKARATGFPRDTFARNFVK